MLLDIPLAIWMGVVALIFLVLALVLGQWRKRFGPKGFAYHRYMAMVSVVLLILHTALAIMLWFMGIVI